MTTLDILRSARALIADKGWTQKFCARDAQGVPVSLYAEDAASFCMLGATARVAPDTDGGFKAQIEAETALRQTIKGLYPDFQTSAISYFNDVPERTKDEVLDVFDKTIARFEGRQ